jgi:hypothetical protein
VTSSAAPQTPQLLPPLEQYLEVCKRRFAACVSQLNHPLLVDGVQAEFTLHFVKFDPTTKEPKFGLLAKALAKHVVRYCLSAKTRADVRQRPGYDEDEGELFIIARDYFRKIADSGEVGELLLFFLLEAAIGAPQVVCKMELKTNRADEVKGTDGIHVKWDAKDGHLDVYLGESKLYQDIGSAMTDALQSVQNLYLEDRTDVELHLVTSHFKQLDEQLKDKVTSWVNRETAESECHIIHACLIGWDWNQYARLATDRDALFAEFEQKYRDYTVSIGKLLAKRFDGYAHRHLSFHFLFIPFASVGEFRRAFYEALLGVSLE